MSGVTEYLDVLRLSTDDIENLLRSTQRHRPKPDIADRRAEARHDYRGHPVVLVQIEYPDSEMGAYRAVSSNISENGICFFHGKFTYPGSVCRVLLRSISGELVCQSGHVVRCELLKGRVHEVGVRFDAPIDLSRVMLDVEPEDADPVTADAQPGDASPTADDTGTGPGPGPGTGTGTVPKPKPGAGSG